MRPKSEIRREGLMRSETKRCQDGIVLPFSLVEVLEYHRCFVTPKFSWGDRADPRAMETFFSLFIH